MILEQLIAPYGGKERKGIGCLPYAICKKLQMDPDLNVKDKTLKQTHRCIYMCFICVYMYKHSCLHDLNVLKDFLYAIKVCSPKSYIW